MSIKRVGKTYVEDDIVRLHFDEFDFAASYLSRDPMRPIDPEEIKAGSLVIATYKDTGVEFKGFGGMTILYCQESAKTDSDGRRFITCS